MTIPADISLLSFPGVNRLYRVNDYVKERSQLIVHLLPAVNGFNPVIKSSVKVTVFMNFFLIFFSVVVLYATLFFKINNLMKKQKSNNSTCTSYRCQHITFTTYLAQFLHVPALYFLEFRYNVF